MRNFLGIDLYANRGSADTFQGRNRTEKGGQNGRSLGRRRTAGLLQQGVGGVVALDDGHHALDSAAVGGLETDAEDDGLPRNRNVILRSTALVFSMSRQTARAERLECV